ncbi:hypothetical protein BJY21_003305 [Kineosphaera limosa]|uniref:Putative transcriptional regulator n=1 Tax=Kineosphaera limosa NBRC 100340 TaxID=1184609 RepID=K6VGG9_9MICO|nr:PucR family transcriptional regulator [Kineosphaera limosa]NYE02121.1 hypothetical protein [Kineosphaera limosa]GAB95278.1 putative transcriptional regulator [Kineosphaera limosa NBRC 100340]
MSARGADHDDTGPALQRDQQPPMDAKTTSELVRLAAWAKPQAERLADEIYAQVLAGMEAYRDETIVPVDDLRRSIARNLRFMIDALADPSAVSDPTVPADTGRRRAVQGMPLPEVLRAYRLTFMGLWDLLSRHAQTDPEFSEHTLLAAATRLWTLSDDHAGLLTEAYRAQTMELLAVQHRRRGALVEALFSGENSPQTGPWETARLLGLPPDANNLVVAAETCALAEESLPGIEARLAAMGVSSAWRLTPALQLGIVAPASGQEELVLSALQEVALARVGVSPPFRALADRPRALHLARIVLSGIPARTIEVRTFPTDPLAAMLACSPLEARRLADTVLGSLLELPKDDRVLLLETLDAYLQHDASADLTGRTLHCHANTVRYRLRRIEELTQRSTRDPMQLTELASALVALRVLPDEGRGRRPRRPYAASPVVGGLP